MIDRYGVQFADGSTDAAIELWMAFDIHPSTQPSLHTADGFLGAFIHLQRAVDLIWNKYEQPQLIWNEWTELMLRSFIENREVSVSGAGASWKSSCMGIYANCFWLADPLNTRIVITSTTLDGLRARIWKEVIRYYRTSRCGFGNTVNHPHPQIQTTRGDNARGIFGIAVEAGDIDKAIENIQGRHAPRTLVEIDEMTGVSEAIIKAGANLEKGTICFQMIGAANPESYFDQHGKFSEPEQGWNSISPQSGKWKTVRGGIGIHLNGLRSPNVMAGKNSNPGMITLEDIEISKKRDGENSPQFWKYVIGFWAPEGITTTVLTESIVIKFKVREQPVWVGRTELVAMCDVAFEGGDRKPLGFAKVGKIDDDGIIRTAFGFTELLLLKVDVTSKEPIHFQLARQIQEECDSRGVNPFYFGMDTTGEGGGTRDILKRQWSDEFLGVEFGGRASDRQVSDTDPRKCYEVYGNRVSELWYQTRRMAESNQLRGMPIEVANEFCQRNYELRGNYIYVEPKRKMKMRIGRSPDLADMWVVGIELAIDRGLLPSETFTPSSRQSASKWMDFAKSMVPKNKYAEA